jgi:glycosyltransferase involved in cell wall biosynthesis
VKVLLVSHYLLPHSGGIEVLVDREARLLARAGHEVALLASAAGSGEAPAYTAGVGVPPSGGLGPSGIQSCEGPPEGGTPTAPEYPANVRACRVLAWNGLERRFQVPWPVFSPALVWRTWRLVRWCDAVHAHGFLYLSSVLALLFARLQGKPSLLTEHIGLAWYASRLLRLVQRIAVETAGRLSTRVAGRCIGFHDNVLAVRCASGIGPQAIAVAVKDPRAQRSGWRP